MKVVLDTNVLLVSIPFGKRFYPIFDAFLNGAFDLCFTTDILRACWGFFRRAQNGSFSAIYHLFSVTYDPAILLQKREN